jgi:alanine racemase
MNSATPATVATYGGRLTIDLRAIQRNWTALDSISQGALTGAVVKADAYGCGIAAVAPALKAAGAQFFFTATLDEAITLRAAVPEAYIFVFNGLLPRTAEIFAQHRLMPCLNSLPMLEDWLSLCVSRNEATPAALHFDTGMNRLGFRLNEISIVKGMVDRLGYEPQMLMSHFACADQPQHEKNRTQLALFQAAIAQFPEVPASLSNSAGMMIGRENHFQMVRPGIALYGGRAVNGRKNPMAPVVTLEAPVLQIKDAKTGESVGYGATQTLVRDSRLAILSLGYADGFFRALSSSNSHAGGKVAWNGRLAPIAGRVSMDLVAVEITDLGDDIPVQGSMVEILGPSISVDDQAEWAGTIGYEVLTSLKSGRYERSYIG